MDINYLGLMQARQYQDKIKRFESINVNEILKESICWSI